MKEYLLPVALQIIGFLVILAEIFIPSLGLLTLIAVIIYAFSLYLVYTDISTTAGIVFTVFDVIMVPIILIVGLKILAKSPLALRKELSKNDGVVSQKEDLETYLDMEGVSVTDLRPAGTALIKNRRLDVVTDGEYVEKDTPILVTGIAGNRIVVEAKTQ